MASTFTIPLTTLPVGTLNFPATGGASVPDADSEITLTIDRTVAGGLNAQPATTVISIAVSLSRDGGTTWQPLAAAGGIPGGLITGKTGATLTSSSVAVDLPPGTSRQIRASVTVSGAAVAVAGTLVTQ